MRLVADPSRDTHIVFITPRLDNESAARLNFLVQRGASVLVAALMWDDESAETLGLAARSAVRSSRCDPACRWPSPSAEKLVPAGYDRH